MNREMICTWLGLADKSWPPDPYALLGLSPAECDAPTIEKRVHERMTKLRCYQLSHPEEATEGMNRVAQAFIYLVEQHCPRTPPKPPPPPKAAPAPPAAAEPPRVAAPATPPPVRRVGGDTAIAQQTKLDWQAAPPPVRGTRKAPLPAVPVAAPEPPPPAPPAEEERAAPAESEAEVIRNLAEESEEARAGLVTLQQVVARVESTRQLLIAWRKAGRYLANSKRKLTRSVEKADFGRRLEALLEAAEAYPAFVAHPGRPGYHAVALAHLEITPEMFNAMGDEPREQLARDWVLTHRVLLAHRVFLLRQFKSLRRRGRLGRVAHTLNVSLHEHPVLWTGLGAAVGITACVLLILLIAGG
jgi:hypothetical protein